MKQLAILSGLLALFLFFAYPSINPAPFAYDEADYMYAAGRGFLANYLDLPSLSFPDYVRMGISQGTDPSQRSSLSLAVRRAGDMFLYRHAHGPVYFYWLGALSQWSADEHFIRAFGLAFPILAAAAIYLGCLWMLPAPQGQIAAILGCALYLFSPAVIRSTEVAPHQMFTVWFIVTLLLLAKFSSRTARNATRQRPALPALIGDAAASCGLMAGGSCGVWYAVVVTTALAFCTLEVTFVLIAVVLVCGYLERRRLGFGWRLVGTSLSLFAATVVILHPAAITRLAFAKSYLFYAYLAVKRTAPWGDVTFADTWASRFSTSPVAWILIAIALFFWIRYRDLPGRRQALPFLLFGTLMLATMLRVLTTGLRYVLPFFPALLVFTAIILSGVLIRLRPNLRAGVLALVCGALLCDAYRYTAAFPFHPDPRLSQVIAEVRQRNLGASRLLVPHDDLPTIHYYFPGADVTPYLDELSLPAGRFDAIVRMSESVKIDRIPPPAN
jgi:hypothetical protein